MFVIARLILVGTVYSLATVVLFKCNY